MINFMCSDFSGVHKMCNLFELSHRKNQISLCLKYVHVLIDATVVRRLTVDAMTSNRCDSSIDCTSMVFMCGVHLCQATLFALNSTSLYLTVSLMSFLCEQIQ